MLLRHVLTPPPTTLPRTVRAGDVGGPVAFAELRTSRRLVMLAPDVAVLPGASVTRSDRLVALAARIPPRTVVGRLSAAWVHTGHGDPLTLAVLYPPTAHRPHRRPDLRTHQATVAADEVEGLGGLLVTRPLRTAVDLARHVPRELSLPALERLCHDGLLDTARLAACLRAHPPGPLASESLDVVAELAALVSPRQRPEHDTAAASKPAPRDDGVSPSASRAIP